MSRDTRLTRMLLLGVVTCLTLSLVRAEDAPLAPKPRLAAKKVGAVVVSSLPTKDQSIRQYAFDGDPATYYESAQNPTATDHFSLLLDSAVAVTSIEVQTGKPDGSGRLTAGVLEISADGKTFEKATAFTAGLAACRLDGKAVKAVRIRPTENLAHPLVIREIAIASKPAVAVFKYPVEIVIDVTDAPELKAWGEQAARICERQYDMICDELASPGFKPYAVIHMALKSDYDGVAMASGDHITGAVKYFKGHPADFGAMVHETTHCVQRYRSRRNPGWLVEGIADYVRFFKYEPGNLGRINADRARYDGSYRVTAAFLNFVTEKYNPLLVKKLNAVMREGKYEEGVWKELTGKTVEELNQEWRRSMVK